MLKRLRFMLLCGFVLAWVLLLNVGDFDAVAQTTGAHQTIAASKRPIRTSKRQRVRRGAPQGKIAVVKVDYIPPAGGRTLCSEQPDRSAFAPPSAYMMKPGLEEEPPVMPQPTPRP